MKKAKQILAIIGVVLLVLLYASTLVFALIDDPRTFKLLGASVSATIIIPVVIWVIGIFVRLGNHDEVPDEGNDKEA